MSVNIYEDKLQHASLFGKDILCINWLILRETVPQRWYCYDLRDTLSRPGKPTELVDEADAGHVKTVLSPLPLKRPDTECRRVGNAFCLHGEELTLAEYCEVHGLECPADERKFTLRSAFPKEAGLFYALTPGTTTLISRPNVLHVQRMNRQPVGRVTYADGTEQEFTDPQEYLRTIREELSYRDTTGFRYETLTDDPQVRRAVDDMILDFAGEENPPEWDQTERGQALSIGGM